MFRKKSHLCCENQTIYHMFVYIYLNGIPIYISNWPVLIQVYCCYIHHVEFLLGLHILETSLNQGNQVGNI